MKRIAAALLAVFALSACAVTGQPARPGTAATYDGATITTADVAAWGTAQNDMGYSYDPGAVLTLLLLRPTVDNEAANEGFVFGDDQIASEAQLWMAASRAEAVTPTQDMLDVVRTVRNLQALIMTQEGADAILAALTSIESDARVNPVYGDFTKDRVVATVTTQAQAEQDAVATYGDVNYLVYREVSGFTPNAQRNWMVDAGEPSPSPTPSPSATK